MGFLIIITSVLFAVYTAQIDKEVLDYSYIYNHASRVAQRCSFFAAICLYDISAGIGSGLIFMALFDQILNYKRGYSIMFLGDTSLWDKYFRSRPLFYISVKVISLFTGIYLCIM